MIKRNSHNLTFATDSKFFMAETARLSFVSENGRAVFKDCKGNYGELRAGNRKRLTFRNKEEINEYISKHTA